MCLACNGIRQKVKIIIDKLRRGALHDARWKIPDLLDRS
jgi:hypothetical protein